MMSASYLRMLAGERLISLLLNRSPKDKRSIEALRIEAAKQVVKEARRTERLAVPSHERPTLSNAFEILFARIWRTVQNAKQFERLMARKNSTPPVEPTQHDNPVIVSEPATPASNIVAFPVDVPLVRADFSSAKLIPDGEGSEFPARYHSPVTDAWRQSCELNNRIRAERERRSAQLRNQSSRYVG
jgi:hypothetical protein